MNKKIIILTTIVLLVSLGLTISISYSQSNKNIAVETSNPIVK